MTRSWSGFPFEANGRSSGPGVPDERQWLHVVPEFWVAVKNTLAFARRRLDPARLAGNHVIMATGGTYALYGHLAPGSVAVTSGQQVRAGELVGRVGHSGNSTAPHPHFHRMDSTDPLQANGIPCAFAEYLVERDGQWQRVEHGIPNRRQRIRSVPLPVQSATGVT
jgi:Peptidase family M23